MRFGYFFTFVIFSIFIIFSYDNTVQAKPGFYGSSSGFYMRQQRMRQQQTFQRQQRQRVERQRQANARRQQEATRARQAEQRRLMRSRQQKAMKQRQVAQKRNRPTFKGGYSSKIRIKKPLINRRQSTGKRNLVNQKQLTLRSQRLMKNRQDRLRLLKNNRLRKKRTDKKKKAVNKPTTMAALTLRKASGFKKSFKPATQKQFQKTYGKQHKAQHLTKKLAAQRKFSQVRMQKVRLLQKRIQSKKIYSVKNQEKLKAVQKLAQKNFKSCKSGNCSTKNSKNPLIDATKVAKTRVDKWSRVPKSIQDQKTLEAAKKGKGSRIAKNLGNPKFKGMEKWEYKVKSKNGRDSVVHYVRDPRTNKLMDFKFKKHSTDIRTIKKPKP